jgi:hypothetical protein
MSKETFTNRHGVTSVVDKDEVVAQIAPVQTSEEPAKKPKKKSKKKDVSTPVVMQQIPPKPKKPFPWRVVRVGAVALVAIVLVLMFFTQADISQYQSAQKSMKDAAIKAKSEKLKTEVDLATLVTTLQKDMPSIACPEQRFSIQFTTEAKDTIKKCHDTQVTYDSIKKGLDELKLVAQYGTNMTETMKPALANASDGTFANISDSTAKWQAAAGKIKTLTPPERLRSAHQSVVDAVAKVASSWQKLKDADTARDTSGYETAKTELSNSYDSFRVISEGIVRDMLPLQKQLVSQINSIN